MRRFLTVLVVGSLAALGALTPAQANATTISHVDVEQTPLPYMMADNADNTPVVGGNVGVQLVSAGIWGNEGQALDPEISVQWYAQTSVGQEPVELAPHSTYGMQWVVPEALIGKRLRAHVSATLDGFDFESVQLKTWQGDTWFDPVLYPAPNPRPDGSITVTGAAANNSEFVLTGSTLTFSLSEPLTNGLALTCAWMAKDPDDVFNEHVNLGDCSKPLTLKSAQVGQEIYATGTVGKSDTQPAEFTVNLNKEVRFPASGLNVEIMTPSELRFMESGSYSVKLKAAAPSPAANAKFSGAIFAVGEGDETAGSGATSVTSPGSKTASATTTATHGVGHSGGNFTFQPKSLEEIGHDFALSVQLTTDNYDTWSDVIQLGQLKSGHIVASSKPKIAATYLQVTMTTGLLNGTKDVCSTRTCQFEWLVNGTPVQTSAQPKVLPVNSADYGKSVQLRVTVSELGYDDLVVSSAATVIPKPPLTMVGLPKITGTVMVGSTVTAVPGTWGQGGVNSTYQWSADGKSISGATQSTFTIPVSLAGKALAVSVTGIHNSFESTTVGSNAANVALAKFTPVKKPRVQGKAVVGAKLTASAGQWTPAVSSDTSVSYQWYADGKPIKDAPLGKSLTVRSALVGKKITVRMVVKRQGFASAHSDSDVVKISKSRAVLGGKLSVSSVKKGKSAKVAVKVRVPGTSKPVGTVKVTIGKKSFSKKVTASAKGKVTVSVKGLAVGKKQAVKVKFVPSGSTAKFSKSSAVTVVGKLTVKK